MLNVKSIVYSALSADTILSGKLPGGIHSNVNDNAGKYPALVYDEISNVPAISANNAEALSRATIQITVLTDGSSTSAIAERVNAIMLNQGFSRQFAGDITSGNIKMKVMRYVILG